jgi:hypothetical protein
LFFVFVTINEVEVSVALQVDELHWIACDIISSKRNRRTKPTLQRGIRIGNFIGHLVSILNIARGYIDDALGPLVQVARAFGMLLGHDANMRLVAKERYRNFSLPYSNWPTTQDCVRQARSMAEAVKEAQEFAAIKTVGRN